MDRRIILILAVVAFTTHSVYAKEYMGAVLYPFAPPAGYSSMIVTSVLGDQASGYGISGNYHHALLWSGPSGLVSVLDPNGFIDADILASNGVRQVGYGYGPNTNGDHALLWSGTASSAIDLNPAGLLGSGIDDMTGGTLSESFAEGIYGNQEVGYGTGSNTGFLQHALLWSGSAGSVIDLNPTGVSISEAFGTDGQQQVGWGGVNLGGGVSEDHAFVWSGSAGTGVDLNPSTLGFTYSKAYGVAGNQQVGFGESGDIGQALLWKGTAASVVDLAPTTLTGFYSSFAVATNGLQQVGYGGFGPDYHALLWSNTGISAVDLQSLLPEDISWIDSYACTIDADGNVYGYAIGTLDGVTGDYAIEWSPVPEPIGLCVFYIGGATFCRRNRW